MRRKKDSSDRRKVKIFSGEDQGLPFMQFHLPKYHAAIYVRVSSEDAGGLRGGFAKSVANTEECAIIRVGGYGRLPSRYEMQFCREGVMNGTRFPLGMAISAGISLLVLILDVPLLIAKPSKPMPAPTVVPLAEESEIQDTIPCVDGDNPPTTFLTWSGHGGVVVDVVATEAQSGAFTISGIPLDASIVWAYMYEASWQYADTDSASATFDGNPLPAVLPFDHDSGWGSGGQAFYELCAYRWDVTPFVTGNGVYPYSVSVLYKTFGEALVVLYSHPSEPRRQIIINDGAESLENASSSSDFAGVTADSATLFLFTQADDSSGTEELISFNGTIILGPGDVFHMNRGFAASLFELPVQCISGINIVTCSTDVDWFGWHLAILETYGVSALVTGGGWIPGVSLGSAYKRTFGFNVHSEGGVTWGQLQFNDHAAKMKVHSDTIETLVVHGDTVADFSGLCGVDGTSGYRFECEVEDRGEPGQGRDRFSIYVYDTDGNPYYSAGGFLGGGNIQIHTPAEGGSAMAMSEPMMTPGFDVKPSEEQQEQPDTSPMTSFGDSIWSFSFAGDNGLGGMEFDGNCFYLAGDNYPGDSNMIYVFDRNGNYLREFAQKSRNSSSLDWGWMDLAYRQDHDYFFGSDDSMITAFDRFGNVLYEFPGPYDINWGLAWDGQYLWVGHGVLPIVKIDTTGVVVASYPNPYSYWVWGLAWDDASEGSPWLWISTQGDTWGNRIYQFDPTVGQYTGFLFSGPFPSAAGGLAFSTDWDTSRAILFELCQWYPDYVIAYDLGPSQRILDATVDKKPEVLNLKSKGRWVTCYI
ncbi:DUF3344 domain-containing protein, partial [candidate division TA06 bacterium]